jgi:hypothetical protein
MPVTPNWSLPYPCSGDTIDPSIFCDFSDAVDTALTTVSANADFVANRPNARITRNSSLGTFTAGAATNVQFDTELFDNDNMASLGVDNAALTIQTPGVYWIQFSLGNFSVFTTWTRYLFNVTQNGTSRIYRKWIVDTGDQTPTGNSIQGIVVCQAADVIRGQFTFIGTGGPMVATSGSLSASFICDL